MGMEDIPGFPLKSMQGVLQVFEVMEKKGEMYWMGYYLRNFVFHLRSHTTFLPLFFLDVCRSCILVNEAEQKQGNLIINS